jgi:superfamily II DNA or RNA helicase
MRWRPKTPTNIKKEKPAPKPEPRSVIQRPEKQRKKTVEEKPHYSQTRKPEGMSLEDWQRELRKQFGREQQYHLVNVGEQPFFSEFAVTNPQTKRTYCVRIRGLQTGDNHCSCPDFTTNTLGTCKHIEFTLSKLERRKGGREALKAGYQPPYSEVFLHYGAQREVRFRPGSNCSKELARLAAGYFDDEGHLLPDAFARFDTFVNEAGNFDDELYCHDDVLTYVAELRDAESRRRAVSEAFPKGIRSAAFKDLLKINLYDYQREGALFAARCGRCLIGDDMGLGKTVQAIAAAEIMARLFNVARVLVVCPTSLKHQWEREIKRFSDRTVEVIVGLRERRQRGFATDTFFKVMNYDTVHRDLDMIATWAPDLVILDEAQRIKNWNTRTARSVKQIQSTHAIVLTGTPLENRLEELISIVQFVDQYRLGPTFKLLNDHQNRDEVGKVIGYRNLDQIGKTLEPILVRRHKQEVLAQLPDRIDNQIFVQMTKQQRNYHDEALDIVARIVYKWRRYHFLSEADRQRLMIALQRMRMSCDSTYLVDHTSDHGFKADEITTILDETLEEKDTKIVIFSQWLRMHEILVRRLKKRRWDHVLFHGGVPTPKRKVLLDRFRDDPGCRLFLSTDAGGTGLNLQHASMVINVDLPWNPAVLEQRIGRLHRLGQDKVVRVINFVAQGTIEQGMLEVLKFKKSLFAGILDGGAKDIEMGGTKLNRFMETVERVTTSIPEATVEEADMAYGAPEMPETLPAPAGGSRKKGTIQLAPQPLEEETHPAAPATDVWGGLLQAGMALLQQLATPAANGAAKPSAASPAVVQRDKESGETYLRLPIPSQEVLEQVIRGVGALLEGLRTPRS